jgi:hypothetical protein
MRGGFTRSDTAWQELRDDLGVGEHGCGSTIRRSGYSLVVIRDGSHLGVFDHLTKQPFPFLRIIAIILPIVIALRSGALRITGNVVWPCSNPIYEVICWTFKMCVPSLNRAMSISPSPAH